jgi:adenosine deaminase
VGSDSTVPGVENGLPKEFGPVPSRDPLPTQFHNRILARRAPKAELHCHLQGALRPSQFHTALQRKRSRPISRAEADSAYDFISFNQFFADLDAVCELWGDTHSITLAVLDVLAGAYDLGCRHLELMITPDLHRNMGISPAALLGAAGEAFTIAADTWDMTGGIIVEMHRDRGKDAAIALVRETARLRAAGVPILGYGNDGDHKKTPLEDLAPAYRLAREEGYRLCGHAANVDDVEGSLDMSFDRIDHGFFVASNPRLMRRLVGAGTPLTLCPTSGVLACGHAFVNAFKQLQSAGVPICIATDDPPLFFTDIAQEYSTMATALGWSSEDLGNIARNSLQAAWLEGDGEVRRGNWITDLQAYVADARHPRKQLREY